MNNQTTQLSPLEQQVWQLIDSTVQSFDCRVVRVQFQRSTLQVMLEPLAAHAGNRLSVTLDQCAEISRAVAALMDVEDPINDQYNLEMSSTGIERPLVLADDFAQYAGDRVVIQYVTSHQGRRKHTGQLVGIEDGNVTLNSAESGAITTPITEIKAARLAPSEEDYATLMKNLKPTEDAA